MGSMKNRMKEKAGPPETSQTIAEFGDARLVRCGAKVFLEGGSMADRMDALEWARSNLPGVRVATREPARLPVAP